MSSPDDIAPPSFIKYEFTDDDFNGPLNDSEGRAVYMLSSLSDRILGTTFTTVTRPDGETVGTIDWPRINHPQRVTFNGVESRDLVYNISKSWFKLPKYAWKDDRGNELYWKFTSCYTAMKQVMAIYKPEVNYFDAAKRKPALLFIDPEYSYALDHILFTALLTEMDRKRHDRRRK